MKTLNTEGCKVIAPFVFRIWDTKQATMDRQYDFTSSYTK